MQPKICYTAAGVLIHKDKVLLVKHKKLGIWLNPGGHIEVGELPHQAAEREFFEETGVKVRAVHAPQVLDLPLKERLELSDDDSVYLPVPILINVHWVCKENFERRSREGAAYQPISPWKRGCEQHLGFLYLLEPVADLNFTEDTTETDGIGWFTQEEIISLETNENIRVEIFSAFKLQCR